MGPLNLTREDDEISREQSAVRSPVPVIAVADAGAQQDDTVEQLALGTCRVASAWFERVSAGKFAPEFAWLGQVTLPGVRKAYGRSGGMGSFPHNSQQLAVEVLSALPHQLQRTLHACGSPPLFWAPQGFHPHAWRFREGGFALGERQWIRRYAVVPKLASYGSVAHELAHLLLDWPDLRGDRALDPLCLMARGAELTGSAEPALPCAPLRLRAGWCSVHPLERRSPARLLDVQRLGTFRYRELDILVERRPLSSTMSLLLGFIDWQRAQPRLLFRVPLAAGSEERPILGFIGSHMRDAARARGHRSPGPPLPRLLTPPAKLPSDP